MTSSGITQRVTERNCRVMIRNARPRLTITTAGNNRRHVRNGDDSGGGGGGSLLWIVLVFYFIATSCSIPRNKAHGDRDSHMAMKSSPIGFCNLDDNCDWGWNHTRGFRKLNASTFDIKSELAPKTDADNSTIGLFLWYTGHGNVQIWSTPLSKTDSNCVIEFWVYQVEMKDGYMNLVIQTNNTSSIAVTRNGSNNAKWEKESFSFRAIDQPYRLFLEFYVPYFNSSVGVDNFRLINCFPEPSICTDEMFLCNNGTCVNKTRICDFIKDCPDGEDEEADCDKIPKGARCNFENGWCGWRNVSGRPLNWTLHHGPGPSLRTGPSNDHTYNNATGMYAFVKMGTVVNKYGSRATMESPLYNPPPPYTSDSNNSYYHSCQIRFFYNKHGRHAGSLGLFLVQVKPYGNQTQKLWWSYGDNKNNWLGETIPLPNISHKYFFQFEAGKGVSSKGDMAIDDISLSRECFGIGVPLEVLGEYDYNTSHVIKLPLPHPDFENETVIRITTCGATGRMGPTAEKCNEKYNNTDVELIVPSSISDQDTPPFNFSGVQRWTAPRGEYYTLIGVGARGGAGSGENDPERYSRGALIHGVIELQKGDQLYFIVGQEGTEACSKSIGMHVDICQLPGQSHRTSVSYPASSSMVHEVKKVEFKNGGGGGGGATVVFMLKANGELEPILIAAGGGGLGSSTDSGSEHGHGPAVSPHKHPSHSLEMSQDGHGASWNGSWINGSDQQNIMGMPLILGGLGGLGCEPGNKGYGNGGFGGGGGGCQSGGGGGGFIGGNTGEAEGNNGEGGYSYASQKLTNVYFKAAAHPGPGHILIIPAISGCGCDYRCVALDEYLNKTKCICPQGWLVSNDSKSCIMIDDSNGIDQIYMIPLIIIIVGLFIVIGICLISYKRYQNQKALLHRRQVMFGNGTELTALRAVSDTMMTEFNPNYEFAGNLYSFKDLSQIPRDCITLVKPLGQGAFGEVFQGVYKYKRGEEHPVAVKTLPSLSTTQAEADFMMEALIMSKFNHPNIVHFIGVSFDKHPRYIILELLAGGDLKNFLREERPRPDRPTSLTMLDLIMCGFDVANGCKYMEEARFIHRDIAARNCLLSTKAAGRTVKIADFGMARDIYRSDYYRKGGKAMLPIKWMPPESFLDGIFTTKTDVWAFGVLLWEIMSFGYMPYTGCANREVMSMVTSGGRLEKPAGCPDPIYGIMTRCWHPRPDDRPTFSTIAERIGYCLQDPDVINHPTPNFDILPICDREITIMRPDPEAECINVQSDLDRCGYMQPRVIDPQSVARRLGQAVGGAGYNTENEKLGKSCKSHGGRPTECRQGTFNCNAYDSGTDTFEHSYSGDNNHEDDDDRDDETSGDCEDKRRIDRIDRRDSKTIHRTGNIEDGIDNINNGNDRPAEECHPTANVDNAITDHRNGNESTTTTDTNSDSLIAQSSDTPPDTTTNSSPNTRTCSPSRIIGFDANVNNVNGMVKNTLKATLSLDPSALCRGAIPYEKIATRTQRSSTPGSMDLRKDSLGHELPREEECSC